MLQILAVFVPSRTGGDVGHQSPCPERSRRPCCVLGLGLSKLPLTDVLDCVAPTQLDVDETNNFWSASRASFTSTEPPSLSRNHLLAVPSKLWPKICSSLLSHHVASVDVTNLKAYVLIKMKDASSLHSRYHTYLSLAR